MYKSVHNRLQTCAKCQFYAYRAAKAPLLGHTQADRIGEKLALDIIQLAESNGYGYALTAEDVFPRYRFLVPLKDIKASTILAALRERILVNGMGKPDTYLVDGGSEFKKEVTDQCSRSLVGAGREARARALKAYNSSVQGASSGGTRVSSLLAGGDIFRERAAVQHRQDGRRSSKVPNSTRAGDIPREDEEESAAGEEIHNYQSQL